MTRLQLAPSILTADFARLGEELRSVSPYVDWFHLDVMDGHYVENITFGPDVVEAIARIVDHPLHVHLMIENPLTFVDRFAAAGARRISFHPEVADDSAKVVEAIRAAGCGVGIAVHPDRDLTEAERHLDDLDVLLMMTVRPGFGGQKFLDFVVPKISDAVKLVENRNSKVDIEVDGGVNLDTVEQVVEAGASIIVAGSAVFDGHDAPEAARTMRARLDQLQKDAA